MLYLVVLINNIVKINVIHSSNCIYHMIMQDIDGATEAEKDLKCVMQEMS